MTDIEPIVAQARARGLDYALNDLRQYAAAIRDRMERDGVRLDSLQSWASMEVLIEAQQPCLGSATVDSLRQCIADPGSVIPRGTVTEGSYAGSPETIANWGARAILARHPQPTTLDPLVYACVRAARESAEGDSNDDEIQALGDALDAALILLGAPGYQDDAYAPLDDDDAERGTIPPPPILQRPTEAQEAGQ